MIISGSFSPFLASGALQFAFDKATTEGKITIGALVLVSLFSWSVIITKIFQLARASRTTRRFFEAYRETHHPLDLHRKGQEFDGAPAYELYSGAVKELQYQLTKSSLVVKG